MTTPSPLIQRLTDDDASFMEYADNALVAATLGNVVLEYAAIRKAAALIDLPHHATIRLSGDDRLDFLNRMLTQRLDTLPPHAATRAFLITRQGRLIADLAVINLPDHTLLDTDVRAADDVVETLSSMLFAEDVNIEDASASLHRIAIHGPTARALLAHIAEPDPDDPDAPPIATLAEDSATRALLAGAPATIHRCDVTGAPGLFITASPTDIPTIDAALIDAGVDPETDHVKAKQEGHEHPFRLRRIGWHALNIARIEAGVPLFNVDFSASNVPAETGVLHDRVSFTKGCYPGQEIVARMHNLGHPKQILCALRIHPPQGADDNADFQPRTGAALTTIPDDPDEEPRPVGAVTSSAPAPMLSAATVCFAQLKWDVSEPGTTLAVDTAAGPATATVQPSLRFLPDNED